MNDMMINEIYRDVRQGEGPSAGRRCAFLRFAGCSLGCIWCDIAASWRWSEKRPHLDPTVYDVREETHKMSIGDILHFFEDWTDMLVITGGEPLAQPDAVCEVIDAMYSQVPRIEVETSGAYKMPAYLTYHKKVFFNVSPKLSNSGVPAKRRLKPVVLRDFLVTDRAVFKYVISTPQDLEEVIELNEWCGIPPDLTWLMPEGVSAEKIISGLQWLDPIATEHGFNLTSRQHVLVHGSRRAV